MGAGCPFPCLDYTSNRDTRQQYFCRRRARLLLVERCIRGVGSSYAPGQALGGETDQVLSHTANTTMPMQTTMARSMTAAVAIHPQELAIFSARLSVRSLIRLYLQAHDTTGYGGGQCAFFRTHSLRSSGGTSHGLCSLGVSGPRRHLNAAGPSRGILGPVVSCIVVD